MEISGKSGPIPFQQSLEWALVAPPLLKSKPMEPARVEFPHYGSKGCPAGATTLPPFPTAENYPLI